MEKKFSFIIMYCLTALLGMIGLFTLLLGDPDGGMSEAENRTLQGLPSADWQNIVSGGFGQETESYLSDQVYGREKLLNVSASVMDVFSRVSAEAALMQADMEALIGDAGSGEADAEAVANGAPLAPDAGGEAAQTAVPADGEDASTETERVDATLHSFCYRNTGGGFSRIYAFSDASIAATANALNLYRNALPEDGNVFFTYVPYSQVASGWLLHTNTYCGWVSDVEPAVQELANPGVHVYSSVNILEPHLAAGEPAYYMTDHHWSGYGAHCVMEKMLAGTGVPSAAYRDYEYLVYPEFLGSIYDQVHTATLGKLSDKLELPYPLTPTRAYVYRHLDQLYKEVSYMESWRDEYSAYLGGSHKPWYLIETGFHTGRNALVIGDSFANAFTAYLTPYYDTVCLCDLRGDEFKNLGGASLRSYIKQYQIDDVYFVVTTGTGINSAFMQKRVPEALG